MGAAGMQAANARAYLPTTHWHIGPRSLKPVKTVHQNRVAAVGRHCAATRTEQLCCVGAKGERRLLMQVFFLLPVYL